VAVIPPAAGAAPGQDVHPFGAADLDALLPHVDLFSLNACARRAGTGRAAQGPAAGQRACAQRHHGRQGRRDVVGRPAAA